MKSRSKRSPYSSRTGGRDATQGVIPGRFALSVGLPDIPYPEGWRWVALSEVAQLESGHTPSRRHPEYWDGDVPWIGIRDAVDNHGRTISDTVQHVSKLGLANSSSRLLPAGTVCLSRTASVGYVVVMDRPMATSQDFVNWVCSDSLEPDFLKYILLAEGDSLMRFASGTTHQTIYYPEAKAFHVLLPPIQEQRRILNVLGMIDKKIELNRKTSATLAAMTHALFKSWFIDFEPVRAKAEGRDTCLPTDVARHFPSDFVDSDIGDIPKGWACIPIREATTSIQYGLTASATKASDGPKFLRITDIQGGQVNWQSVPYCAASDDDFNKYQLMPGDVVVARTGASTGENFYISHCPRAVFASYLVRFQCADRATSRFVGAFLRTPAYFDYISNSIGGSAQPNASAQVLAGAKIALPPPEIREQFMRFVAPLDDAIHAKSEESQTLASLRDALLPKLISGQVRLGDTERMVEKSA